MVTDVVFGQLNDEWALLSHQYRVCVNNRKPKLKLKLPPQDWTSVYPSNIKMPAKQINLLISLDILLVSLSCQGQGSQKNCQQGKLESFSLNVNSCFVVQFIPLALIPLAHTFLFFHTHTYSSFIRTNPES